MQLGFTINRRPFVHDLISGFDQANKIKLLVKQSILISFGLLDFFSGLGGSVLMYDTR